MPAALFWPFHRATSPSTQSKSRNSCMRTTARTAPVRPGIISAAPEATPHTTMVQVSWSGVTGVRTRWRVVRREILRM